MWQKRHGVRSYFINVVDVALGRKYRETHHAEVSVSEGRDFRNLSKPPLIKVWLDVPLPRIPVDHNALIPLRI